MTRKEIYLAKAAELSRRAKTATNPAFKARFERMAAAYVRLAEVEKKTVTPEKKVSQKRKRGQGPHAG
jgi:hypothetical protein